MITLLTLLGCAIGALVGAPLGIAAALWIDRKAGPFR
jgi:hypothetical protein